MSSRRERSASMIQSPKSGPLLAMPTRPRLAADSNDCGRRHTQQAQAQGRQPDEYQLAPDGSEQGDGENDEIEGTDVPFYISPQYDSPLQSVLSPTSSSSMAASSGSSGEFLSPSGGGAHRLPDHTPQFHSRSSSRQQEFNTIVEVEEEQEQVDAKPTMPALNLTPTRATATAFSMARSTSPSEQWQLHQPPHHPSSLTIQLNTSSDAPSHLSTPTHHSRLDSAISTTPTNNMRDRLQIIDQIRPHTTSHAALSERETNFHLPLGRNAGTMSLTSSPTSAAAASPYSTSSTQPPLRRDPSRSPTQSHGHSRTVSSPAPPAPLFGTSVGVGGWGHHTLPRLTVLTEPHLRDALAAHPDDLVVGDDSDDDSTRAHALHRLTPPPSLPLRGASLLASIIRAKVIPAVRGKWSSGHIVQRFLAHKYGDFDVSSMLAQQFGLDEFRQRMAARLHHLDSSQTIAATTTTMVEMFSSLKTFHKLLDGTSVLNAHLSKRQALLNIISTVHTLLDAEMVTVYLLVKKGESVALKAVTGVQRNGAMVLRPAELTLASELVSLVARTGELRNIRDCSTEPLCWVGSAGNGGVNTAGSPLSMSNGTPASAASSSATPPSASSAILLNGISPEPTQGVSPYTPSHLSSAGYVGGSKSSASNSRAADRSERDQTQSSGSDRTHPPPPLSPPSTMVRGLNEVCDSPHTRSVSSLTGSPFASSPQVNSFGVSGSSTSTAYPYPSPHPFLTPQHPSSTAGLTARDTYSAARGDTQNTTSAGGASGGANTTGPKHLFDRAASAVPPFQLRSCLCVPVRGNAPANQLNPGQTPSSRTPGTSAHHASDGAVVAVVQACNKRSGPHFTNEDVQILQFVGLLAGQSLSNASLYEEALVRRRQQEALMTMIELMSAETGVDEVIECIIDAAYRLLDVDRISLYMVDENRGQLVCKVSKDPNAIGQRLPLKYGLIGIVAAEGKSINISDCANDPRCKDILTLDKVTGYTTRNILTLPIQDNKKRVAAVIQVINKKGAFTSEDETLMQSLSRSAGQILRKAQLFGALLVEQRKTKALMAILQAEESEVSIESLMDRILQTAHDVLPCQKVALFIVDAVREDLYALVSDFGKNGKPKPPPPKPIVTDENTPTHTAATPVQAQAATTPSPKKSVRISSNSTSPSTAQVSFAADLASEDQPSSSSPQGIATGSSKKKVSLRSGGSGGSGGPSSSLGLGGVCAVASTSETKHLSFPLKKGLAGWAAEHGQSVNVTNAAADARFDPTFDQIVSEKRNFRTRSALCIPLHNTTGTTIAVLQAVNRLKKKEGSSSGASDIIGFSDEDEEVFRALCIQVGITLRRRLTEVLLGRSRRELGDDRQINSLFEVYGGNYLSGHIGHTPGSNAMSTIGPFAGLDNTAESIGSPLNNLTSGLNNMSQDRRSARRKTMSEASTYHKFALPPHSPVSFTTTGLSSSPIGSLSARRRSGTVTTTPRAIHTTTISRTTTITTTANVTPRSVPSVTKDAAITPNRDLSYASPAASPALASAIPVAPIDAGPSSSVETDSILTVAPVDSAASTPLPVDPVHSAPALPLSRPASLDRDLSLDSDSGPPAARGTASNNDEITFIRRRRGVRFSHEEDNADAANTSVTALVTHHRKYSWPILPSSPFAIDITLLHSLDTFNVFDYSEDQLIHCSLLILQDLGLVGGFGFSLTKLQKFLVAVRYNYNENSYHNYYHGFGVMHFAYWMLRTTEAGAFLPKLDQLSLLIAALCHDIDHPGTTNGFQIAAQSDLALAHNDQAVLEMHHAFVTFELLRDPELNVLAPNEGDQQPTQAQLQSAESDAGGNMLDEPKWTAHQFRAFRKTVISAILSTDMSKHFDLCRKLDNLEPHCDSLDSDKEEDRQFIIDLLTHCADLSGQVLPYHIAVLWESRLTQEFIWQSNMEQKLGLPVSTFMQGLSDNTIRFKNHINFIDFVMNPLWMGMVELFPPLSVCVKNLLENRKAFMRFIPVDALAPPHPITKPDTSPNSSEPVSPTGTGSQPHSASLPASDGSSRPTGVVRSVTLPYRSLKVGLLRQQRGHSPPSNVRSNSLTEDEQRHLVSAATAYERDRGSPLAGSSPMPHTPSIPMCTHRDASNAKDAGFCHVCADEQSMPIDVVSLFNHGVSTPDLRPMSGGSHRRKLSAPLTLSPAAAAQIRGNSLSSPNAIVRGPHSRHSSNSSNEEIMHTAHEHEESHSHSPYTRNGVAHARDHSLSGYESPLAPDSPQLIALHPVDHRRRPSLTLNGRKSSRWNALTSASGEPVRARPFTTAIIPTNAAMTASNTHADRTPLAATDATTTTTQTPAIEDQRGT